MIRGLESAKRKAPGHQLERPDYAELLTGDCLLLSHLLHLLPAFRTPPRNTEGASHYAGSGSSKECKPSPSF
ncbi:Bh3-Like Motif-Containing Cell Death Inducer [Manis pentadactyla]|nr:Bh3-Like Motif-Containing Cell Death Inducer [Manis pentadactyla]